MIPHITNEIKKRIYDVAAADDLDFVLVEIGGTVGDIESIPFLEAIRQIRQELGASRVLNVHLTLVPTSQVAGRAEDEADAALGQGAHGAGHHPRHPPLPDRPGLSDGLKSKIALFCNVSERNVISAEDITGSIYEIPYMLHENGYDSIVLEHFQPGREAAASAEVGQVHEDP